MKPQIIGVAGPAGAGKDTVADYLVSQYGFVKLAFAGPLKAMLAAGGLAEPADRALKEEKIEGFSFTWRRAAQTLGTEWGRALDPDIWTKMAMNQAIDLQVQGKSVVFSDVRFENEGQIIRAFHGRVLHLIGRKIEMGAAAAHASETGVLFHPSRDALIENAGSIGLLYEQVDAEMGL